MKIGIVGWAFTEAMRTPFEEAIKTAGKLGFKAIELIASEEKDLTEYYTHERNRKITELCESCGLNLSQFSLGGRWWWEGGISSFEEAEKRIAMEHFRRGVQIAKELGTEIIAFVSHWPIGIQTIGNYLGRDKNTPYSYIYPTIRGAPHISYSPKLTMILPRDFSWERTWENYVKSVGMCADIARDNGILLAIEGHTHVIVPHTDSVLRLIDEVKSGSLGMNLDTGFQFIQREYVPLSILKLGKRLFHVHVRDGDGLLYYGLPPGQGIIDWDEVVEALKHIGYEGTLSLETSYPFQNERWIREGKEYLERLLNAHHIDSS